MHAKTEFLIEKCKEIIGKYNQPLTVRQIYYQLVAELVIPNNMKEYRRVDNILVLARRKGLIHPSLIIDRTREPRVVSTWNSLSDFLNTVRHAYRREIWSTQPNYIEVWLEKDALSGIFEPIIRKYRVPLIVSRGYPSFSALYEASLRFEEVDKPVFVLYFGDFDPTGEDIYRSIQHNLYHDFGTCPYFEKVALTKEQVEMHNLPPMPTKHTDTRTEKFVQQHGDMAVELDALPPDVLQNLIEESVLKYLDMRAFNKTMKEEKKEERLLIKVIDSQFSPKNYE